MFVRVMAIVVVLWAANVPAPARAADATRGLTGLATIYRGGRTASGETAPSSGLTAAHRTLPFGTMVRVTNHRNGSTVVVRINDRGPFTVGRIIDLTPAAARQLGFSAGETPVTLAIVGRGVAGE
jgi:rare lipoprotein A